jgi:hypothetical protein
MDGLMFVSVLAVIIAVLGDFALLEGQSRERVLQ